jgi:hypothetical protein
MFGLMHLLDLGLGDVPEHIQRHLSDCTSVPCWLLGHEERRGHNPCFQKNLEMLEKLLVAACNLVVGEDLEKEHPAFARALRNLRSPEPKSKETIQ